MSSAITPLFASAAVLSLLSLQLSDARAANNEVCRDYAVSAIRQVHIMHEHPKCDRGHGARWSDDWNVHYQWCRGVSYELIGAERDARTNWIRACTGR